MICSCSNGSYNYPSQRYTQGTQIPNMQMPTTQMSGTQMSNMQMPNMQMPSSQMPTTQMPAATLPRSRPSKLAVGNTQTAYPIMPQASNMTPTTVESPYYTAGLLRNFIGQNVRVEFLIGTSGALTDRLGMLMDVGASYIILQPIESDDLLICDLYSIKFVTVYR